MKDKIGKYELLEQIGVGGFGEVFKAFDPLIKRYVALKTCTSISEEIRSRFFQEAEIAGNLHHRNITTVYDFGLEDGLPYLVQEYLSGEDLDRKIKRRDPLPFGSKLGWLLQVARGLAAAHAAGVIHRDIKPANIRVLDDGSAKIMDFGIAKLIQQESGLTQTGMTIGTAAYLSPEQVRGDAVDARTDVFSFGVLAYELLTYSRPFEGREISAVLYQVLHSEPRSLVELWPGAPPGVVTIVRRCLEKSSGKRYADGSELARELERLHSQVGTAKELDNAAMTMPLERPDKTPVQGLPTQNPPPLPLPGAAVSSPAPSPPWAAPTARYDKAPAAQDPPPRPAARPQLPLGSPPARPRSGIDSFELSASTPIEARDRSHMPGAKVPKVGWIAAGAAALSIAALIGFSVGHRGASGTTTAGAPPAKTEPAKTTPVKTEPVKSEPVKTEPVKTEPVKTEPVKTTPVKAEPPPADSKKPPAKAVLNVPAPGWTDGMVMNLGRRAYRLDKAQSLKLDPGSYNLTFEVQDEGYQASVPLRITLAAGETRSLPAPIAQPGLLSVRPLPRRPAGDIFLDLQPLGAANLARRKLAPGSHQLEIRGRDGAPGRVQKLLQIESGRETVVSFDLEKGEAQIVVK